MSRTILHEYEEWLDRRLERGEIAGTTRDTYLNDASRVLEVLLRYLPPSAIEGFMQAEGYRGYYGHVVDALRSMARRRGEINFREPRQPRLPGV